MEQNDHDLIVELRTEFRAVRADIKELKETTIARITAMEADKLGRREFNSHTAENDTIHEKIAVTLRDHETRIRWVERSLYIGFGILIILQTLLSIFGSQLATAILK